MKKVLIANRGEIAVRIQRTLRTLGIRGVIVHHAADSESLAVAEADEAYEIAGPTPVGAYLDAGGLLAAARATSCDAVHPGYGFLAENAGFADAVAAAGPRFIGPPADVIRGLGDKIRARELAIRSGVPVTPSASLGVDLSAGLEAARQVGFPALVKAAAGGGGKGMRIVASDAELASELAAASSEARRSFGDGRIYVERYVERPRHVEVQILSDGEGRHLHLGERECSIQRRFQKLVEESPAPGLVPDLRRRICEAATKIAAAAGYRNAGTVEFLLTPSGEFYFLEVNTRLQVEHPVTELVTGLDLVELQIRIADGEPLPIRQDDVDPRGHAIECRVCAEDPEHDHAPTVGEVSVLRPPAGPGVRFDSGLRRGQPITTAFDSLLAKVVAQGSDRSQATARLRQALRDLVLLGVEHNAAFLERVLAHPAFGRAELHTHFLPDHRRDLEAPAPEGETLRLLLAAAALTHDRAAPVVPEPYASIGAWRN